MNLDKENAEKYQGLFNLMSNEHNLILTISEMNEIIKEAQNVLKLFSIIDVVWQSKQLKPIDGIALEALNITIKKVCKKKPTLKNRL